MTKKNRGFKLRGRNAEETHVSLGCSGGGGCKESDTLGYFSMVSNAAILQ